MHTKALIIVIGVVLGILVGHVSSFGSEAAIASLLIFVSQGIVYLLARIKNNNEVKRTSYILTSTVLLSISFFAGVVRTQFVEEIPSLVCSETCSFTAKVVTHPEVKDAYQVFDVSVVGEERMNVRVRTPLYPEYLVGDIFMLVGKVTEPSVIYPHGDDKPFDYKNYLRIKNVGSEIYYPKVNPVEISEPVSQKEKLMLLKKELTEIINLHVSSPGASLASGMLLGNSEMSKELAETFRVSGLSHIVVLSGFNIAILIVTLLFILKLLPMALRVLIASVSVILFVIMVGGEASILRATLMAFVSLLALLSGRAYVAHQALLLSFLIIIFYSPLALLYDVSLHLSFLATAGIVYLHEGIKKLFYGISQGGYLEIMGTTISAYIATLPYVVFTFGTASLYAVFANFVVVPFVPLGMLLTFMLILISQVSVTLTHVLGYAVTLLTNYIIWVARVVEGLPFSSFPVSLPAQSMIIMYIIIIGVYFIFLHKKKDETRVTKDGEIISGVISY